MMDNDDLKQAHQIGWLKMQNTLQGRRIAKLEAADQMRWTVIIICAALVLCGLALW